MSDDAFHEIQLNGKQLVFLFMAATVVAVVIFLCGVMVGRGVRAQRGGDVAGLSTEAPVDPTAAPRPVDPTAAAAPQGAPSPTAEKLSYPDRLASQTPAAETLKEFATPREPAGAPTAGGGTADPASSAASRPAESAPSAGSSEPPGDGFAVQVAAVRDRIEADTIVNRLSTKGYPAYVMAPAAGAPRVFRVRVGKYKDRREAETVAGRLEKEEQFKPWITR